MSLINSEKSQLVVVDVQEKLGAAMPGKVLNRVVLNSSLLLRSAGIIGIPVTCTEQYPQGLGPMIDTVRALVPNDSPCIEKTSFSACGSQAFLDRVAEFGRPQIVLAGMEAHVCVLQTAVQLHEHGYQVFTVEDAICSRKLENYQNALERIRQAGVLMVSAESVVFEWLRDSKSEHFKALSPLLR